MEHLIVDITPLLDDPGSSVHIQGGYDVAPFDVGGALYTPAAPASVDVTLLDSGTGIVVTGTVAADFLVDCSRCLVPFTLHVDAEVEGAYLDEEQAAEMGDDEDFEPLHGDRVDLRPLLDASIRVELPFAPVHDESCKGICPQCGCNLNEETCDCDTDHAPDGPFGALRGLLQEED